MKRRRGFSLVEILLTATIMGMVIAGASALTISMAKSFNRTTTAFDATRTASQAVQHVSRDLQEAKQVTVLSPSSIRVFYPTLNADGSYNRLVLDTVNTVDFYRGDANGTANANGTCLLRKPAAASARAICKYVTDVQFATTSSSSVDITLATQRQSGGATGTCNMVHRAIFLRNY